MKSEKYSYLGRFNFLFLIEIFVREGSIITDTRKKTQHMTKVYEKRACNFHRDCTVSKILIVAKMCGRGQMEADSSPVNAILEYWVSVSRGSLLLLKWF